MKERRILLTIGDEDSFRRGIRVFFENWEFEVLEAEDGESGISICRERMPHVVLVDLSIPGMSGLEVIKSLKKEFPTMPVVALSNVDDMAGAMDAFKWGASDFITKPVVHMARLGHAVKNVLEGPVLPRESQEYGGRLEVGLLRRTRDATRLNDRLKTLVNSIRIITGCSSIDALCRNFLEELAVIIGAEGGSLYLLLHEKLVLTHTLDSGHAEPSIPLPLSSKSVFGRLLERKTPLLIPDIRVEKGIAPSGWSEYKDGSLMAFPLVDNQGEVLGMATLHNKAYPPFGDQDREIGAILGSFCCEALKSVRAMDSLRKSEEKYRNLVENMNDAVYALDAEGKITYMSPVMEKITGFSIAEGVGFDFKSPFNSKQTARLDENFKKCLKGEPAGSEYLMYKKSGERLWVRTSSRPIRDGNRVVGLQGVLMDITESKETEARLENRATELAALNRLGKAMGADLSIDFAVKTAFEHVRKAVGPDFSILFLREGGSPPAQVFTA